MRWNLPSAHSLKGWAAKQCGVKLPELYFVRFWRLLTDYFNKYTFVSSAVKFSIENSLPGPQIKPSGGDWDDHLMMHQHGFEVGIAIGLSRPVVLVSRVGGGELFQPAFNVLDQSFLVIVDVHSGRDVHRADQGQTLLNFTLAYGLFNLWSNVHILMLMESVEGEVFGMGFHLQSVSQKPRLTPASRYNAGQ